MAVILSASEGSPYVARDPALPLTMTEVRYERELSAVYIVANKPHGVLYIGVTSDLAARVRQHREGFIKGFTWKYNCKHLVYYEVTDPMEAAIFREKQRKGWVRNKKISLIETMNPRWEDLYNSI
jgi:putative endonuclease